MHSHARHRKAGNVMADFNRLAGTAWFIATAERVANRPDHEWYVNTAVAVLWIFTAYTFFSSKPTTSDTQEGGERGK